MANLRAELQQSKPFSSLQEEVLLNILRTSAVLTHRMEQQFRPFGVTSTQYNALRIVAGAGPGGIAQCDIAARLVANTPDVPRLLKRTEAAGLIERSASDLDKRTVRVRITAKGKQLLSDISRDLPRVTRRLFPRLTAADLRTLNRLLDLAREQSAGEK